MMTDHRNNGKRKKSSYSRNTNRKSIENIVFIKRKNVKERRFVSANRKKLTIVFFLLIFAMGFLIFRLNYINFTNGEDYAKQVLLQQQYNGKTIPYRRGDIVDRNGVILATSEKVYNMIVDAYVILHAKVEAEGDCVEPTLQAIDKYFADSGVDVEMIRNHIKKKPESRYFVVKKHLPYDVVNAYTTAVNQKDEDGNLTEGLYVSLKGVWFEEEYVRKYPYGSLACDVIGFTSSGNVGALGLEAYYNDELNGINGREYGYMNDDGVVEYNTKNPENGNRIVTTLDINVQKIITKHLYEFNEVFGSRNSAVVVQNAKTGEILGMASYPYFDLNNPYDVSKFVSEERWNAMTDAEKLNEAQIIWRNFCVTDTYEPGSTVKPMTVAMALDENLVDSETHFNCEGSKIYPDGTSEREIGCNRTHGNITLSQAIEQSCNVAMMDISDELGVETLGRYLRMYGMGQKTGVDLPGESSGILYKMDVMSKIDAATNAFGQNYNVNTLQMTTSFASVVNGGSYYRPHLVSSIQTENGSVVQNFDTELVRTTVSKESTEWILNALEKTVTEGTGAPAAVEGYRIGGKTGTAEKIDMKTGTRDKENVIVSFISAAPINDPEIILYVVIDEPNVANQADSTLPTVMTKKIYTDLLPYLQIFPEGNLTNQADDSTDNNQIQENETKVEDTETTDESADESNDESTDTSNSTQQDATSLFSGIDESVKNLEPELTDADRYRLIREYLSDSGKNKEPFKREHIRN